MSRNKGVDRATPFKDNGELDQLAQFGYTFICRYISRYSWKNITKKEAKLISDKGLYVVLVYQNSNNRADYFNGYQGKRDGYHAIEMAESVGAPSNAVIYFAVDFDATGARAMPNVYAYFKGVIEAFEGTDYRIGVYGSYGVCVELPKLLPKVEFRWQTYAWSKGKVCDYSLYQWKNGTKIPEDRSGKLKGFDLNLSNGNGGGWKYKGE